MCQVKPRIYSLGVSSVRWMLHLYPVILVELQSVWQAFVWRTSMNKAGYFFPVVIMNKFLWEVHGAAQPKGFTFSLLIRQFSNSTSTP